MALPSIREPAISASEAFPIPLEPRTRRLESIDILRGLLMLLMALDHTREYFSVYRVNPVSPQDSWPALYATRWLTHLCAPGFIALAGASIYLQRQRTPIAQIQRLAFTRGLWLVFLEVTLISFGWSFIFPAPFLQVIWAVGIAMMGLSLLLRLPTAVIGGIGAAIVLLHNLLDPIEASHLGGWADLWRLVHEVGMLTVHGQPVGFLFYPALPWFGIICLGYAFGPIAASTPQRRRCIALILAATFFAAFAVLRLHNRYGDEIPFKHLATPARTIMSFFNVNKYPPSLEYVLITFTVLLLLYIVFDRAVSENVVPRLRAFVETYGRVPFFYYVLHIYLIHGAAVLASMALHQDWHYWIGTKFFLQGDPDGWGVRLVGVYCIWLAVILVLYLPCRWFAHLKATRRDWWLSYV
jgi:uncharacterized membrane protein